MDQALPRRPARFRLRCQRIRAHTPSRAHIMARECSPASRRLGSMPGTARHVGKLHVVRLVNASRAGLRTLKTVWPFNGLEPSSLHGVGFNPGVEWRPQRLGAARAIRKVCIPKSGSRHLPTRDFSEFEQRRRTAPPTGTHPADAGDVPRARSVHSPEC